MLFTSKLPHVGTTIFTTMSQLAKEHNAINLSQGFPDFECAPQLLALADNYMKSGYNQYAPMQGTIQLRERIAELLEDCYSATYNPDTEITITAGATQAIYTAIAAFINKDDEVIVFEPVYDCYVPAIEVHGAKPIRVQLTFPNFTIDWQEVAQKITAKTRMIIINTPHNPSGTILTKTDLVQLEKLVQGKNIIVLSDEVYEHMVYDNEPHESVARHKTLAQQSIIASSFGKTVHTTGWKIGYVAAPKELMVEFRKVHQFLVFSVNHALQLALADFLKDQDTYLGLKQFYQEKRDYFLKLISTSRFKPLTTKGTYFQLLSYEGVSEKPDTDFAIELTKQHKVASIPLSVFYSNRADNHVLRFCFAKRNDTLEKAADILCNI